MGQGLQGVGTAPYDAWTALPKAVMGVGTLVGDAYGYASQAIAPQRSVLTGEEFAYQPNSALLQSIQQQGVLGTVGSVITGAVHSAPGIGLIGALGAPNRNWRNVGSQTFNTGAALLGASTAMRGANTVAEELALHARAAEKGYPGVQVTPNGGPTFANTDYLFPVQEGQQNVLNLKMTGSRRLDFKAANEAAGLQDLVPRGADSPSGYVWHHVDDFNPTTGTSTLELVERGAHNATIPHKGSVYQWEQLNGVPYKR